MNYVGSAQLVGKVWQLKAPPHVVMRLKRVFPRIDTRQHGTITLKDSTEVCRELLWFSERYPLDIQPLEHAQRRGAEHKALETSVLGLMTGQTLPFVFDLKEPPREYQRVAADLALRTGGLLVADDVGLGKTCTAIACLTDPRARPALVVTLTHLPLQWRDQVAKFTPGLRTHIIKKGQPYDVPEADVYIINYHKLAGWADHLATVIRGVVYDEVQELRHHGTGKYTAAQHISEHAWFRLGLSATPIFNFGGEMWSVVEVLRPGALGDRDEFINEWCTSSYGDKPRVEDPKAFGTYLRDQGLMIRRTRRDVGRELPPLSKIPHVVDTDAKPLEAVSADVAELARIILAQGRGARDAAGELNWRLRQATGIAKAPHVADFVKMLLAAGESRVLLFGWHREVYSIWADRLKDVGVVFYTGSETTKEKEAAKAAFVSGAARVLVMSLRSGAGIDGLQFVCRTVVFGELDWSPAVHEQDTGRVDRDGQIDPVMAYYLLSEWGSDPVIADCLGVKKAQSDGIRDPAAVLVGTPEIDPEHMKKLARDVLRRNMQ